MSIYNMTRRTQTYVAGDWDGDNDAILQVSVRNLGHSDF